MALEDWLLEGEAIRFSAYDFSSKTEIVVTDRRLIFYRSSLVKEILETYNLAQIAGCRIEAIRRIILAIIGAILMMIGIIFTYVICSEIMPIMPVIFGAILAITSLSIAITGFTILLVGLLSQQTLELTIAGRRITKPLKLSEKQLKELSKAI